MKNYKKIYLLILLALIFFVAVFLILKFKTNLPRDSAYKLLKKVFENQSIVKKGEKHYLVGNKDYYVESLENISNDNLPKFVVMEIFQNEGKNYKFYSEITSEDYEFIGEEGSTIWYLEEEKNKQFDIILKDITGDGFNEIMIPLLRSGSNFIPYRILTFDNKNKKLIKIYEKDYFSNKLNDYLGFDEIYREDNFIITIDHGTYSRTKSYYSPYGNTLNFERSTGAYGNPDIEGEYKYKEIDKQGNVVYEETRKGSVWTDSLSR